MHEGYGNRFVCAYACARVCVCVYMVLCQTGQACQSQLTYLDATVDLASSPGLLIGGRGEKGEGLISTTCACAMFSVCFTVKVSVNVYRRYPYVIGLFKI